MNLLFNVYDSHTLYITLYQCSKCTMSFTDKKFVIETGTKYVSQSSNKHSNWNASKHNIKILVRLFIQSSYIYLHVSTFKKFVSDNMILFGITVTFFSKTCRLSFILLKQNINVTCNSLTSNRALICFSKTVTAVESRSGMHHWLSNLLGIP